MQRIRALQLIFFSLSLLIPSLALSFDLPTQDALKYVQKLIDINNKKITDIASELDTNLKQQSELSLARLDSDRQRFSTQVNSLVSLRKEYLLRQDFYDRLKLQIEKYYRGKNLETLLSQRLDFMLQVELKSQNTHQGLWQFMHYLRTALKKIPERNENPLAFIEGYIEFSTIQKPKTPHAFSQSRDYINTYSNQKANDVKRTDVGQKLEGSLQKLNTDSSTPKEQAVIVAPTTESLESTPVKIEPEQAVEYEESTTKNTEEAKPETSPPIELKTDVSKTEEQDFKVKLIKVKDNTATDIPAEKASP